LRFLRKYVCNDERIGSLIDYSTKFTKIIQVFTSKIIFLQVNRTVSPTGKNTKAHQRPS
jgi:hypothetical protein